MKSPDRLQARFVILILTALVLTGGGARWLTARSIPSIEADGAFYGRLAQIALAASSGSQRPAAADRAGAATARYSPEAGGGLAHPVWPGFFPALTVLATRTLHPGASPERLADPEVVERSARAVGVLLGALLALPVFLLGRRVSGTATGLVAATLVTFHPRLIFYSAQALTEMPFAVLVAGSLAALPLAPTVRFRPARILAAAVFAGCAAATRPEGIVLAATGALAFLVFDAGPHRRRVASAAGYTAALLLTAALYVQITAGRIDANSFLNPAKSWYNAALAYAGHPGVPSFEPSLSEYNNLPGGEAVPVFRFADFALANPGVVVTHMITELPSSAGALLSLAYWPFVLLALYGIATRARRLTRHEGAWLLTWGAFVAMYACVFVYRRFLAAFLPLLLIEAAAGLAAVAGGGGPFASSRRRLSATALLGLLLLPAPWLVSGQIRREGYAPELKEAGRALASEGFDKGPPRASAGDALVHRLLDGPGVVARKPIAAYYASLPIRAMPPCSPDSLEMETRARGGAWLVVDERNLVNERPGHRALLESPRGSFELHGRYGAPPNRAVLLHLPASPEDGAPVRLDFQRSGRP